MKEHLGIITNDTSTTQFSFLVSPMKNKASIEKENYVALDHPVLGENHLILAHVNEIKSYEEIVGSSIRDKTGRIIATANTLGYVNIKEDARPLQKLLSPPSPGGRVYLPYAEFLEDTFSRNLDGQPFKHPLHIGKLEATATSLTGKIKPINFYIDAENFTNKHSLIAAMDGAGKTHTATIIIEEIANKTTHPIVILDPHGEYTTINTPKKTTKTKPPSTVTITNDTGKWNPKPTEKTKEETLKALTNNVKPNQTTILNSKGAPPEERKNFFNYCIAALWNSRLKNTTKPFLLVAENAETLNRETLENITSEGTKTGVTTIIISKHPTEIGGKILSQTSTQIIGRTIDKNDIEYLENSTLEKTKQLPKLKTGQWIINSITMPQPTEITVRES
jgi:DNA helicase HerA-like ATPase